MKPATVRKTTSELTALIEQWLETFHPASELPHLPDDVAYLMAHQPFICWKACTHKNTP